MDIPRFDGSDPNSWIFHIGDFFKFHGTPDDIRLRIVSFHMDGPATAWFQWAKINNIISTWPAFLTSLREQFSSSLFSDPQGSLSKLTQTTTVVAFQALFEELMNQVRGIPEHLLINFFITGLKSDIRRELSISLPTSLMQAFALAQAYKARLDETKSEFRYGFRWPTKATPLNSIQPSQPMQTTSPSSLRLQALPSVPPSAPLLPSPQIPIKRMIPSENKEKWDLGLCYTCDKKWPPNHGCRNNFLLLFGADDNAEYESIEPAFTTVGDETTFGDISSLHSLSGSITPRSLHLTGSINGHQVRVIVDSDSTHNFIQPSIVESLKLPLHELPSFVFSWKMAISLSANIFFRLFPSASKETPSRWISTF